MRIVRRLLQIVALVLTLVVGATAAALIVSQTAWFKNWLRGYIVSEANQYLNGELTIGRLGGNLFFGVELENVGVMLNGSEVVSVRDLGIDYSVFELVSKGLSIDDIRLNKPVLHLQHDGDGWALASLLKRQESEADRSGPASPIEIGAIGITDGSIVIDRTQGTSGIDVPERIDRLDARLSFKYQPVHYSIEIAHVSFRATDPSIGLNALSGGVAVRDDTLYLNRLALRTEETSLLVEGAVQQYLDTPTLNLQVSSDKVSLPELARVIPALEGVRLQPAFEVRAEGPLHHLAVDVNLRASAGQLTGRLVLDASRPDQSATGTVAVRHLNLAPILNDAGWKTDLTADARVKVQARDAGDPASLRGSVILSAPRIAAMGYEVERVKAALQLRGADVDIQASAAAYGIDATASGRVGLPVGRKSVSYDLTGRARGLDLRRLPASLQAPPAESDLNVDYHVRGVERLDKRAVANDRRRVALDLRFDGSRVAGAALVAGSTAGFSLDGDNVAFDLNASVAELNLQRVGHDFSVPSLASERFEGQLGGRVAAKGNITAVSRGVSLDNVNATVNADLDPSRIGTLVIDQGRVDADYQNRSGVIRQFDVVARDLNVKTNGILALDEAGQSNLTFHLDTPRLEELAALAGLDASGIVAIDGTLTGNAAELFAKGRAIGSGVNYGESGALSVSADFEARIPDLTIERATVDADTRATFLTVAGQDIDELAGTATYASKQLRFDATASQAERSVAAAGSAAFHPDHQEIHLERLALRTRDLEWQLASGSEAAIRYGKGTVELNDIKLVSGDQSITAGGTIAETGNALTFAVTNVELANVDAMLMRPPQFSGRLNASGRVQGTTKDPALNGEFTVNDGGFRDFRYQTFGGAVDFSGAELTVDVRLQQNATQWLTAKGTLPVALFSARDESSEDSSAAAAPRPIDLTIDSSPIDLGLVQGFTTAVTKVGGTMEAHVRLTGTADEPRPDGAVTVKNGALTVAATGVPYKNITGRIDLHPDRLHIEQITVLDNHDSALTVTGDLAVRERQLGDVQLYVIANDFKVVDSKMGNVRIESSLEVNGQLEAPRISGYLGVTTGQLNLDEIIAVVGPSAYSTTPTEFVNSNAEPVAQAQESSPGVFDRVTMDVTFHVPNDLIVRSSSLQTPGSPIGLGALNVTLGGDLRAVKEPGGRPQLYGSITTVRGTYDFQARRFEILRDGGIRFDGVDELNPRLDIRTRRVIQGVEANVNVRGTLKEPEIVLTSNPPLEEADILALVVFNQPLNQLGEGQRISLAGRAQAMAAGAVANQLADSIGGALHLDTFEIELAPDADVDATVTIGQQVGRNLYVKLQRDVGDTGSTNFILEYEINRWLRLQTNVLQGSSTQHSVFRRMKDTGMDLLYFFSY
jgi:autotransporter translocation and assembly factor TamB